MNTHSDKVYKDLNSHLGEIERRVPLSINTKVSERLFTLVVPQVRSQVWDFIWDGVWSEFYGVIK